ncbi:hypothetical protein DFJ74DRAFT_374664 [Hyaloraphidium curvatum]|nr:hypothetical protein DFJ74DRAFT_374664 [Hyaloraphidium curvatum]
MAQSAIPTTEEYNALLNELQRLKDLVAAETRRADAEARRAADERRRAGPTLAQLERFPPLVRDSTSSSGPSTSMRRHSAAATTGGSLGLVSVEWRPAVVHPLLLKESLYYGTERDVQAFVEAVLLSAANSLFDDVDIRREGHIGGFRPNIFVVVKKGPVVSWPIGVCEVKLPRLSSEDDATMNPVAIGQLHDYMALMRSVYGLESVFGILTDFENWRIFWDPATNDVATATDLVPAMDATGIAVEWKRPSQLDTVPDFTKGIDVFVDLDADPTVAPRKLHATRTFRIYAEKATFLDNLGTTLCKMYHARRLQPKFAQPGSAHFCVTSFTKHFLLAVLPTAFALKGGSMLQFVARNRQIASSRISFYLLYLLGKGRDGEAWFAATKDGRTCVVKFRRTDADAEREAGRWQEIWDMPAYWARLGGGSCVVMPYLRPVQSDEWNDEGVACAVQQALVQMVQRGFRHGDVLRRHVGLYKRQDRLYAALFDLSDVTSVAPEERPTAAAAMMSSLLAERSVA